MGNVILSLSKIGIFTGIVMFLAAPLLKIPMLYLSSLLILFVFMPVFAIAYIFGSASPKPKSFILNEKD